MSVMKIALPVLFSRIAPVFDTANRLLVIELIDGKEHGRKEHDLEGCIGINRAARIDEFKVDQLICGAISRPLEKMLQLREIEVTEHICGLIDEVVEAYLSNQLMQEQFLMPGCAKQRSFETDNKPCLHKQG